MLYVGLFAVAVEVTAEEGKTVAALRHADIPATMIEPVAD